MDPTEIIDDKILAKDKQTIEKNIQNSDQPDRIKRLKEMQEDKNKY